MMPIYPRIAITMQTRRNERIAENPSLTQKSKPLSMYRIDGFGNRILTEQEITSMFVHQLGVVPEYAEPFAAMFHDQPVPSGRDPLLFHGLNAMKMGMPVSGDWKSKYGGSYCMEPEMDIPGYLTESWAPLHFAKLDKARPFAALQSSYGTILASHIRLAKDAGNQIDKLASKLGIQSNRMIYRGFQPRGQVLTMLQNDLMPNSANGASSYIAHEFGPGLYFTPDLPKAMTYAGKNGVVMIVNWDDQGGQQVKRGTSFLKEDLQEWQKIVKWNLAWAGYCRVDPGQQPNETGVIVYDGPMTCNHDQCVSCSPAVPDKIQQIAIRSPLRSRTTAGWDAVKQRLVGFLFLGQ
jgi:hypothetical protein